MHLRHATTVTILLLLTISACSPVTQAPPPTETPPELIQPTKTELPATSTTKPEATPSFTPAAEKEMGTPVPDWEGMPVMPGADVGRPAGFSYIYSVSVTVVEAEEFYMEQMDSDGWILSKRQTSETSLFGGPATILDFQRDQEVVNVMLIYSANENYTMVMLTKVKP